jgi:hypothetical protein
MKHENCLTQHETLPLSFYLDFSLLNFQLSYTLSFLQDDGAEGRACTEVLKTLESPFVFTCRKT